MLSRFRILLLFIVLSVFCRCEEEPARIIPVFEFFKTAEKSSFKISPDGKYISYLKPDNGKKNLFIKSLMDGSERAATFFSDYSINEYHWTFNNQIVFSQDIVADDTFKMYALDINTLKLRNILTEGKIKINILNRSKQYPDIITIKMNKRDPAIFDIYRLNIQTGILTPYLLNPGNITEWFPDPDGDIRLVKASDGVNETILYRPNEKAPFKPIIVNNFKNSVKPIAFTGVKNYFYALSNVNRDKTALVKINAENGVEENVIFASDKADVLSVDYSKNKHQVEYASWDEAKPQKHFLNAGIKHLFDDLLKQLKGNEIDIVDRDSAETKYIINSQADRNPGSYYLYERSNGKLIKLGDINSSLKPAELCEMQPISYKASDGLDINGYITYPKGKNRTNLPVVVMPHDGPYSGSKSHNVWGFDAEVQFLANRGYAVLQVNYRGTTGYGKAFRSAGFKQVGGKIQQDITDGVKWLIDNKTANPKRIAIFGGGFGGFSALYGVSFHPELYNCAIVQYGLINFFTYIKDAPPFFKPYLKMLYEMVGNPETDADQLRAISPVFHADKIKVPLLIFQGAKDPRANISELNHFVLELRKRDVPVSYFLKDNERMFFRSESDRTEMYTEIEKFLNANMRAKP